MLEKDLYSILMLNEDATSEEINNAFRILADKYHPTSVEADNERYKLILQAYEILGNPSRRREYDIARHMARTSSQSQIKLPFEENLSSLPPVTPVTPAIPVNPTGSKNTVTLQSIINLLYEQINYETLNHNPAKAQVYQEIYDEIIKNKRSIETTSVDNNEIWQIIKTYKPYLATDEFNNLKLMVARMFDIDDRYADGLLNAQGSTELPYKKIYAGIVIAGIILLVILGIFLSSLASNQNKSEINENANVNAPGNELANNETAGSYYAEIVDIGIPVNVRSSPTTEWNNIVDKLQAGEKVEVQKVEANGWYYIKSGSVEGYIYGGLLRNNDFPDSYPIAIVTAPEIKVFGKNHKIYKVFKTEDRYVIFYQDHDNYYVQSEKGNLVGISKKDVSLENPQNTNIQYIDTPTMAQVEYFAVSAQPMIQETKAPEEEIQNEPAATNETEPEPIPTQAPDTRPVIKEEPVDTVVPPVIFPGRRPANDSDLNGYINNLRTRIISNWSVPDGLSNYNTVAIFRIGHDGTLQNITLQKSSGNRVVDEASIRAIKLAAPFKPLPNGYTNNYIDVKMNFDDKS